MTKVKTIEDIEVLEKNTSVMLAVSSEQGVVFMSQIGGDNLARLLKEASNIPNIPIHSQENQLDIIGQEILVTSDRSYFKRITGLFTYLDWSDMSTVEKLLSREQYTYSFVLSY